MRRLTPTALRSREAIGCYLVAAGSSFFLLASLIREPHPGFPRLHPSNALVLPSTPPRESSPPTHHPEGPRVGVGHLPITALPSRNVFLSERGRKVVQRILPGCDGDRRAPGAGCAEAGAVTVELSVFHRQRRRYPLVDRPGKGYRFDVPDESICDVEPKTLPGATTRVLLDSTLGRPRCSTKQVFSGAKHTDPPGASKSKETWLISSPFDGECSVKAGQKFDDVPQPSNLPSSESLTVLVRPTRTEIHRNVYHQTLNKFQVFSVMLGVLDNASALDTLIAASTQRTTTRIGRLLLYGGCGWNGKLPPLATRLQAAAAVILSRRTGAAVQWVGCNGEGVSPFVDMVWSFPSDRDMGMVYTDPEHAALLRAELLGPPSPSVLDPKSVKILVLNRNPRYFRSILNAEKTIAKMAPALAETGWNVTGSRHISDLGGYEDIQAELAHNHSVIITAHGQQATNIAFAPECAVLIELVPHRGFHPMYALTAVQSGHIYAAVSMTRTKLCDPYTRASFLQATGGLPGPGLPNRSSLGVAASPPAQCFLGSPPIYRRCVRETFAMMNVTALVDILRELLPLREQCLRDGYKSLPVPDLRTFEEDFCEGRAVETYQSLYARRVKR